MCRFIPHHAVIVLTLVIGPLFGAFLIGCKNHTREQPPRPVESVQTPPTPIVIPVSDGFDYPFADDSYSRQKKEKTAWYNAQDFGTNDHLGEDWNRESGGNTDCGMPVYAVSKGTVVFADGAGPGWGNVIIVRHRLPNGLLVESLYGHLQSFERTSGEVGRRERIGSIGDGGGAYLCHLHFELRLSNCPSWGAVGPGYSQDKTGWTDPSNFVDANRTLNEK